MIRSSSRLTAVLTVLIVVGMVVPGGALASHDGSGDGPLSGSIDVVEADNDGQIYAWERAAFPLRVDDTEAVTQVPLPDDGIYGQEDTTLDSNNNGGNTETLNPSVGGELVPPAGVHASGSSVTLTVDTDRGGSTLANQDNVQLVAARLTPQDGKDLPSTTQDAIDLLSDVDNANENASFTMLEDSVQLDSSGDFDGTYDLVSGQYVVFAAVKEDSAQGFDTTGSPTADEITVDGDVTIIGVDQLSIQEGATTVDNEPENANPGDDLTFDVDSSDAFGNSNSVTHAVAVYRESTFQNSRFDYVVNPDRLGTDFTASEDSQLEHTIDEVNGVADVEDGTTINGNQLSDGQVSTPTSLGAVIDFIAEDAGTGDPNTDPIGSTQIDASVTAVNDEAANTTVTVGTDSSFSSDTTYRYVVVSTLDSDETQMSTQTGTFSFAQSKQLSTDGSVSFSFSDGDIESADITVPEDSDASSIQAGTSAEPPSVGEPSQGAEVYLDITPDATVDGQTDLEVGVSQDTIDGIDNPTLLHYQDGSWTELDTDVSGNSLSATSEGLSPFAVGEASSSSSDDDSSSSSSSSSSSGGGTVASDDSPELIQQTVTEENGSSATTISSVQSDQTVSINIDQTGLVEDGSVNQVNFTSTEDADDVQVTISQSSAPSDGVPENERSPIVYRYTNVEISNLQNADTTPGTLRFTLSEERLESEDIDPDEVQMYRYSGTSYDTIPTTHLGGDQYRAQTPGYSWFSVGVEQPAQETATDTEPVDEPTDAQEQITATEGPGGDGDGGGLPLVIIGILVAVIAIVAGVLYYRST